MNPDVARLLERYIERRERDGTHLSVAELCQDRPELASELAAAVKGYAEIEGALDADEKSTGPIDEAPLPTFEGFRTVERLGRGGMGEVYKLEDLELGRPLAAKVLRGSEALRRDYAQFLREARALALFQDPGIVSIYDYRGDTEAPVILMEYVEGFEMSRIGRSLDAIQQARLMARVCDTVDRAHGKGIQHRDLKPGNILVDAELKPKIVDFGLAGADPQAGHGVGTPPYIAPEQLVPGRPIDERSDVYALGVIFYELLCGRLPDSAPALRLPMEIDTTVPEPLQAIALKAMERDPRRRYPSAREMGDDLGRYLDSRPVRARPSVYAAALAERIRPHRDELREWLALKLVYPHEAQRLQADYRRLEAREDDWIVEGRRLTLSQISLYFGAFVLLVGGLFYFAAHRVFEVAEGLSGPLAVLALPWLALTAAAWGHERGGRKAVAVAFYLAGSLILPILLVLLFHELAFWPVTDAAFFNGVSNRELQVSALLGCGWAFLLAWRTRTLGLSSVFALLLAALTLAVHTDLGLEAWLEDGRWDLLALHLTPLLAVLAILAVWMDRSRRGWLAKPSYLGAAALLVVVLELVALDGRVFTYLGWTLDRFEPAEVEDPTLLETLAAMTLAGLVIYVSAALVEHYGSELSRQASRMLFVLSPFLVLEPFFYLSTTEEYARLFEWLYLALALAVTLVARYRQRKSFFLAGLFNTALALYAIARRYEWFEVPAWSSAVVLSGLAALAIGAGLDHLERTRRVPQALEPGGPRAPHWRE